MAAVRPDDLVDGVLDVLVVMVFDSASTDGTTDKRIVSDKSVYPFEHPLTPNSTNCLHYPKMATHPSIHNDRKAGC